jgi:hypothetical protein
MSSPENKGYLSGLAQFSPWSSRSATPKPPTINREGDAATTAPPPPERDATTNRAMDHSISLKFRLSKKQYPKDCPPLAVQWYHATDFAKRRPLPTGDDPKKPIQTPKKYMPFSTSDSKAIEAAFQKWADTEDEADRDRLRRERVSISDAESGDLGMASGSATRSVPNQETSKVPVNEDYLFDVDVEHRELAPAYWLGPVYDVRRGTWFYSGKRQNLQSLNPIYWRLM